MASFARTPQDFGGPEYEDGICFRDQYGIVPDFNIEDCYGGKQYFSDGYFWLKDKAGTFNPRDDERVKITPYDNYGGYLKDKLVDGYNISLTVIDDGHGNEQIEISTIGSGSLPPATCCGQVLFAADGVHFKPELPLTACGWLTNDNGILLVVG